MLDMGCFCSVRRASGGWGRADAVDWRVEVIDIVPYSIDEDLEITWTASPQPNVVDLDN